MLLLHLHFTVQCAQQVVQNKHFSLERSKPYQPNSLTMFTGGIKEVRQGLTEDFNCTLSKVSVNTAEEMARQTKEFNHS